MPEIEPTTPETTTAVDPTPLATTGSADIAATTPPDPAQLEQLNQTVYQSIDQAWTTTPVTGESVYRVKVDQNGSILSFEPKSQVATENVDNTPLPGLASSQDVTATPSFAEFDVIFQPTGLLEVNQAE
jgi:nitrate/nitrite transport system ATP-binding protein